MPESDRYQMHNDVMFTKNFEALNKQFYGHQTPRSDEEDAAIEVR